MKRKTRHHKGVRGPTRVLSALPTMTIGKKRGRKSR